MIRHGRGCDCDSCHAGRRIRSLLGSAWVRDLSDEEREIAESHIITGGHDEEYVSDEKIRIGAQREIERLRRENDEDEPPTADPIAIEAQQ